MKNRLLAISVIALFISFFVLLNWNSLATPFERDEGEYAYSAWLLRTGGTPYQDSFLQKPPLIVYTYLLGQIMSPLAVWPPRALAAIFTFLTAVLVGLIAMKEWGKMAGIFSAFLFLPLIGFPPLTPFAANTEKFMVLPLVALLALSIYYRDSKKSWPYLLAGFFLTLAVFYKPICLPVALLIILFWLYRSYRSSTPSNFTVVIKPILLIGSAAIITAIVLLAPFFGVLPFFYQETFVFNFSYAQSFDDPLANVGNYLMKFLRYWWILLLPFGWLLVERPKNIWPYAAFLLTSLLTVFSTPIGHYYLILMPFLALICGALLSSLIHSLFQNQKTTAACGALVLIIFAMLFPFRKQFLLTPAKLSEWVYGTVNPFGESEEVAKHLAAVTNKDDFVFVAGSEPQIYYYAERKSGTRFIITYPLNLPTPYREEYQKETVSDLEKNPPRAIIVSQRVHSGLWNEGSPQIFIRYFSDLVSKNYKIVGGYIWDTAGDGHWQEPLGTESVQNASLLLLTKNE